MPKNFAKAKEHMITVTDAAIAAIVDIQKTRQRKHWPAPVRRRRWLCGVFL
ncbi:MAG: hypothetical protein R3A45_13300 [Bdellovibrionota bacterium]